jgi:hypothetical protein
MQLGCKRESVQGLAKNTQRLVVSACYVVPMRTISVIVGTQEVVRNTPDLRWKVAKE